MKGRHIKYEGRLVHGRNNDNPNTPIKRHILKTEMGDEFTACGIAVEEMNGYDRKSWEHPEMQNGGYCTCPDCIRQVEGWLNVIKKCPGLIAKLKGG